MAKTSTSKADAPIKPDKQQKKQLKREANLKGKIELVLKDLRKAERKVTKATAHVDELTTQLHELNEKLTHQHESSNHSEEGQDADTTEQAPHEETTNAEQESPSNEVTDNGQPADGDSYEDSPAIEELHQASLPPAEGRNDINGNTDASGTTETEPAQQTNEAPAQQAGELITPSEQPVVDAESNVEGHEDQSEADQQTAEHAEEQHSAHRRSHHRTTTNEAHAS